MFLGFKSVAKDLKMDLGRVVVITAKSKSENSLSFRAPIVLFDPNQADSRESLFHLLTKEKYLTYIKEVALFTIFGSMPACRQTHRNE